MTVITVFVILLGVLKIGYMLLQAGAAANLWGRSLVKWDDGIIGFQIFVLAAYTIFGVATNVFAILFMLRSIKLMKCGEFFSRRNAIVLWWTVPTNFFYSVFKNNIDIIYGSREFELNSDSFFIALLLIGFAMIYSTGVRLSEENRLTV